ncbi:MAG: CTP synthetase [Candidatus Collierbacteria bacterium GW2011_GWF2_44_15]|uniref:CTP synthase (glutamine hydrolyzing) n=1 Tax=Candidatus Collierbacteria bacterium GW2011_GWF2_44_15 TaxID=1618404 RepID=A0A0G1HJ07_9BACT|nr:MAG: CTP synthetase [Candidatus Collierbacteria bacterium GW2011_GWF2_44_15]
MYLNVDAGTIRPQEHGEVFVTQDGLETDQDLGNYERFIHESLHRDNYLTTGQVYKAVIDRERAFGYGGEDVEAIPHVTDEIISRLKKAGQTNHADIVIVELGGTVGEYQNAIFFEASRILHLRKPNQVLHIHVTHLPYLKNIGELKSKPAQQSSHFLNAMGIQADFIVARAETPIDEKRREKLAVFCNLKSEDIISAPDLPNIYQVPLYLNKQHFAEKIIKKLRLKPKGKLLGLKSWEEFSNNIDHPTKTVEIAMIGKYFQTGDYKLSDSYISVIEALHHAGSFHKTKVNITWINSSDLETSPANLTRFDGIIVPQGWGSRGTEGKINAVEISRKKSIPYLGLCFGMQMAVIEFARHEAKLSGANSAEADPNTPHQVIHIMPDQVEYLKKKQYGGTIRLGSWPCVLKPDTLLESLYQEYGRGKNTPWNLTRNLVQERHRHRYEVNNEYRKQLEVAGLIISGTSPDRQLIEAIELKDHPFFIGTQFHPEYISRPLNPHPIFLGFIKACLKKHRLQ